MKNTSYTGTLRKRDILIRNFVRRVYGVISDAVYDAVYGVVYGYFLRRAYGAVRSLFLSHE